MNYACENVRKYCESNYYFDGLCKHGNWKLTQERVDQYNLACKCGNNHNQPERLNPKTFIELEEQ